jgi:hypothetical protein
MGLEEIVSKRLTAPYRSGDRGTGSGDDPGTRALRAIEAMIGRYATATPGIVKAGDRTLGVVRLAITEKGRSMIVR